MPSETNRPPTVEDKLYELLDMTADNLLARVKLAGTSEEHPPLTAAEISVITSLLKNNCVSASGAKQRGGKLKELAKALPKFEANDVLEPVRGPR